MENPQILFWGGKKIFRSGEGKGKKTGVKKLKVKKGKEKKGGGQKTWR